MSPYAPQRAGMQRSAANLTVFNGKVYCTRRVNTHIGLSSLVRGKVDWEGDHIRLVLTAKDSKGISRNVVSQVSARLRKTGREMPHITTLYWIR